MRKLLRFLFVGLLFSFGNCFCNNLEQAVEIYAKAEASADHVERQTLFNEALKTFLLEAEAHPSGKLFHDIGNIYAYLGDYGCAIAFYRKAEQLIPRDPILHQNLEKVIDFAGVNGYQIEYPFIDSICLRQLSPLERELLLLGMAAFSLVLFSLNLWIPTTGFKWFSRFAIACTLLLILVIALYHFFMPPRAVVVKAAGLRITQVSPSAAKFALHPGEMVEVLGMEETQGLVRVRTATSVTGYLPKEVICIEVFPL